MSSNFGVMILSDSQFIHPNTLLKYHSFVVCQLFSRKLDVLKHFKQNESYIHFTIHVSVNIKVLKHHAVYTFAK